MGGGVDENANEAQRITAKVDRLVKKDSLFCSGLDCMDRIIRDRWEISRIWNLLACFWWHCMGAKRQDWI